MEWELGVGRPRTEHPFSSEGETFKRGDLRAGIGKKSLVSVHLTGDLHQGLTVGIKKPQLSDRRVHRQTHGTMGGSQRKKNKKGNIVKLSRES